MNAGILVGLTHTGGTSGLLSGGGTLSAGQINDMKNGLHYVNVHSVNFGGGEIRGQVVATVPTMSSWMLYGLGALVAGAGALLVLRRPQRASVPA
jgi:hypothetical protein